MKRLAVTVLLLLAVACGPELVRVYDGPPRPEAETTRILLDAPLPDRASYVADFISCEEVIVGDGEERKTTVGPGAKTIELLPRRIYRCSLRCVDRRTASVETDFFDVGFEGVAGREYVAVATRSTGGTRCEVEFEEWEGEGSEGISSSSSRPTAAFSAGGAK